MLRFSSLPCSCEQTPADKSCFIPQYCRECTALLRETESGTCTDCIRESQDVECLYWELADESLSVEPVDFAGRVLNSPIPEIPRVCDIESAIQRHRAAVESAILSSQSESRRARRYMVTLAAFGFVCGTLFGLALASL